MSLASAWLGSQWLALRLARRLLMSLCGAMDCGGGKQVLYIIIHWPYHYLVAYLALLACLGVFILSYISNFIFRNLKVVKPFIKVINWMEWRSLSQIMIVWGKLYSLFSPPQSPRHLYSLQLPALLQNLIYLVTISTIHTLLTGTKFSIPPWYITHLSTCVHAATPRNRSCSISAPRETGGETCKWTINHHNKAKCQISHFLGAKKVMSFSWCFQQTEGQWLSLADKWDDFKLLMSTP